MLRKLLNESLKIEAQDNICLLYDNFGKETAADIKQYLGSQVELVSVDEHIGPQLPDKIKTILLGQEYNVIIIAIKQEQDIWHTAERKEAKYSLGKRIVSIIVPYNVFTDNKFQMDLPLINDLATFLFESIKDKKQVSIRTKNGTNITAKIGYVFMENGDYSTKGTGGDFPSGEVGIFAKEGTISGKIVYDVKVRYLGKVNAGDVILTIKNDKIENIEGSKADDFRNILAKNAILNYVSEIAIGVNPHITIYDSPGTIVEEKLAGTLHFGHGSNIPFGLRSGCHFDCVVSAPNVTVDGVCLMVDGKFVSDSMPYQLKTKLGELGLLL